MKPFAAFTSTMLAGLTLVSTLLYSSATHSNGRAYAHEADMGTPAADMHHQHGAGETHSHKTLAILPGQPIPTVNLEVKPDVMSGWNLQVKVTNFAFAPERVNTKGIATEGHAHLYVDGKKVTRLYGPWYYLGSLSPGQHTITVTLNGNGHEDLIYNGKPIQATQVIQVPPQSPIPNP
jgi:hypothetical protein